MLGRSLLVHSLELWVLVVLDSTVQLAPLSPRLSSIGEGQRDDV